jgi:hypothetical protein
MLKAAKQVLYAKPLQFTGITLQWNLGSRTPLITNNSVHEHIFRRKKTSRVTNCVSSNKHARRQNRLPTSWEYRRESVSCCVTFAQYTFLLEFAVPSLEFHCVVFFKNILLNKTPWDQRSFGLRTFRVTNGLQELIKFVNRGSTVFSFQTCRWFVLIKPFPNLPCDPHCLTVIPCSYPDCSTVQY